MDLSQQFWSIKRKLNIYISSSKNVFEIHKPCNISLHVFKCFYLCHITYSLYISWGDSINGQVTISLWLSFPTISGANNSIYHMKWWLPFNPELGKNKCLLLLLVLLSVLFILLFPRMKNRFLSKSVAELDLNKDVPCLLSDPFHRTTLPFPLNITIWVLLLYPLDITILNFEIEIIGKREIGKNSQESISMKFHIPDNFLYLDCHSNWKQMCHTWDLEIR